MDKNNLKIDPKLAGGVGIGGYVGTLVVWALTQQLGLELGGPETQAIIGICAFAVGWLIAR